MHMNINKYTEKAQEAVITAQQLAEREGHPEITPEHILLTLVEQRDGIVPSILTKMNADPAALATAPAIALASGAGQPRPVLGALALPAPGTKLRRNPLYAAGEVRWPSERYEREYGPLATYPVRAEGPEQALAGADPATDALARCRVLLALPERW